VPFISSEGGSSGVVSPGALAGTISTSSDGTHMHSISDGVANSGSGSSQNVQPTLIGNIFVKL
jgi:hypothetical protein